MKIKKSIPKLVILCILLGSQSIFTHAQPSDTFGERQQFIMASAAQANSSWEHAAPFEASTRFAVGKDQEARAILEIHIDQGGLNSTTFKTAPEFSFIFIMNCYMRWKDSGKLTPALKQKIKTYVTNAYGKEDGRGTYNHRWMRSAALMLAYQEWPDEMKWVFKRENGQVTDRDGSAYFLNELNRLVHYGHEEYNSSTYVIHSTVPIQCIKCL